MEETKVVVAYVVKRYENGAIDVENLEVEGAEKLDDEQIYRDIEDVARIIEKKRVENAAYAGVVRFYREVEAAQQAKLQQEQNPLQE